MARHFRSLLFTIVAAIGLVTSGTAVSGAGPALPPGITLPTRPTIPVTGFETSTTVGPQPTAPVVTADPAPGRTSTGGPPAPSTQTTAGGPPTQTTAPQSTASQGTGPQSTATVAPSSASTPVPPTTTPGPPVAGPPVNPPPLSNNQVDMLLRTMQRSGASSTSALIEALKPLQNVGLTSQEALALGMGRFPIQGVANWTDDWLDFRAGPPVHQHMGNDLFAAFDAPVRAPADGVVRLANEGLGGLVAYVTTPDGTYYYMAHLKGFAPGLPSGSSVKQGQTIGFNGDSGNAGGGAPHVHFEIHPGGGAAVNPKPIIDGWVAEAIARVPALLASFQLKAPGDGELGPGDAGVPQILVATGLTRRFSTSLPVAPLGGPDEINRAVLVPPTPDGLQSGKPQSGTRPRAD